MTDIEGTDWSPTDASNTNATPNGAPANFARTDTKNIFRMIMGATRRLRDRMQPTISSGGTSSAATLTYTGAPTAYTAGMTFKFKVTTTIVANATVNVSALGAKKVYKNVAGTAIQLAANDWYASQIVEITYDTSLDSAAGGFWWSNQQSSTQGILPRSYLAGCGTSRNSGTPTTKIDIAVGSARDSTNAVDLTVAATLTADCTTTGANALDAGSLANATWYHVYVIMKADGTIAALVSTSATAPTMPSGYTYKRRVGSVLTNGSAQFISYSQLGDEFLWNASPTLDVNATNPGTSAVTRTLTVPTGVQVWALFISNTRDTGGAVAPFCYWSALDVSDQAPSLTAAPLNDGVGFNGAGGTQDFGMRQRIRTNTSGQVRSRLGASGAATTLMAATYGWIDRRGQDA